MISLNQSPSIINQDICVLNEDEQPQDSISGFSWILEAQNPLSFICCAWDSTIRSYDVITEGTAQVKQKACFKTEDPCVSVSPHPDGILAGCINNSVLQVDPENGTSTTIGRHNDAVKDVYWSQQLRVALSLSYDKTLKIWDLRDESPVANVDVGHKIMCSTLNMDYILMGLGNSKLKIARVFDILNGPRRDMMPGMRSEPFCTSDSPFEEGEQITSVALAEMGLSTFKVAIGSDFGNVNVSLYERRTYGEVPFRSQTTFRAHKTTLPPSQLNITVRPVQAVEFFSNPEDFIYTMGAEGAGYVWNHRTKQRTFKIMETGIPITKAQMSHDERFIAYGLGYDWSQGIEGSGKYKTKLFVHRINDEALRERRPIRNDLF